MHSLAVITKSIGSNQLGLSLCKNLNKLAHNIEVMVFIEDFDKLPMKPNFAIFLKRHSFNFRGVVISTDFDTSLFAQSLPNVHKHFLYLYDLSWMFSRRTLNYYTEAMQPDLLVRDESVRHVVSHLWKEPQVLEDWNYEQLAQLVYDQGKQDRKFEFNKTYK
jgi:hypothetical protein